MSYSLPLALMLTMLTTFLEVHSFMEIYEKVLEGEPVSLGTARTAISGVMNITLCAMFCAKSPTCFGLGWKIETGECFLYPNPVTFDYGILLVPHSDIQTYYIRKENASRFLLSDSTYDDTLTWEAAQAFCESFGQQLLYIEDDAQMNEVADHFGNLNIAARLINSEWVHLNGTVLTVPDVTSNGMSGDQCLIFNQQAGYYDMACQSRFDEYTPQAIVCQYDP